MVTVCAPTRPILRPNRPARIAPSSGASTIASNTDFEITMLLLSMSTPGIASALQRVDVGDVDRAPVAEQGDQDRQADRGLGRGDSQDEEHEHLAGGVAEFARKRDEIDVDREQQQLDRHQQHDHVLAIEEDAGEADAEQRRAQREIVAQRQAGLERDHGLASSPGAGSTGFTVASIFTMRKRSAARTRAWSIGFWCLAPTRRRKVSITAATTAMVRMTAATSNGSRKSVNSARASQVVLGTSPAFAALAALTPNGVAMRALTPISTNISPSITTATSKPTGR